MSFTSELQIGKRIASGFFGDVHEGVDNVHGKVAVKVLRPYSGESQAAWLIRKESLLAEAQKLRAAEHDNIVRVHALVRADTDDRLHMVVEFCEKGSLQAEYERAPMNLSQVKHVLTDVCRGLECIHARGMIHRDIKPGNILGAKKRFKIGDFGLVSDTLVFGYASDQGYTDHLAPEVHRDGLTSAQTDVWALGMTIYRILHGHPFYQENFTGVDIACSIQNGGFALKLPWLPHVPDAWRKFLRKAMHDDTKHRFKTAFAMCQAAASLPIEPDWECNYSPNRVTWSRDKGSRQIQVEWNIIGPKTHLWSANSTGGVRDRRLDGVNTPIGKTEAVKALEGFFAAST